MRRIDAKLVVNGLLLVVSELLLVGFAYAQAPAKPTTTSAVVSSSSSADGSNIKPDAIVPVDPSPDADIVADPASLLSNPPPVPSAKPTLVGGTIGKLDRVRDRITVNVFGGGRVNILFDPRTRVFVGRANGSTADLAEGERVYLDTILDGSTVFAKTIRVEKKAATGESQGIVLKYVPDRNELTIRDAISPAPMRVRLLSETRFVQGDRTIPASALLPGSLVAVRFDSEENHDVAREIFILALPGTAYTFAGLVTFLDLRSGLLVLTSSTDHKSYEIFLDSSVAPDENLHPGATVTVVANFQDSRYVARNVSVDSSSQ
jgi:hypothetical protein